VGVNPRDRLDRPLGALRISVTDRCNLRCSYCMPEAAYRWLPAESLLDFDEIARLAKIFVGLGVSKLRITGGEPLLRPGLSRLVATLASISGVNDLALTTNGTRLAQASWELRSAGLRRLTVSLDTLRPDRMKSLTRHDRHDAVIAGLDAAVGAGFESIKLNTVVIRGFNDDELADIVRFAVARGLEPRFIEYMDVGGATNWRERDVVSGREILQRLSGEFGGAEPVGRPGDPAAPAERWRFGDGTVIGVITSTTAPFCSDCDRARLTADGLWYRCLYAQEGFDLAGLLRGGASDEEISGTIAAHWRARQDRGAELRRAMPSRDILVPLSRLREDPRLEMHVRGG
jgi:cyclic pyranopterin phosphate synthase